MKKLLFLAVILLFPSVSALLNDDLRFFYGGDGITGTFTNLENGSLHNGTINDNINNLSNPLGVGSLEQISNIMPPLINMTITAGNNYINVTNATTLNSRLEGGGFTFAFWQYPTATGNAHYILSTGSASDFGFGIERKQNGDGLRLYNGSEWYFDNTLDFNIINRWVYTVITYNASDDNISIYYNNTLAETVSGFNGYKPGMTIMLLGDRKDVINQQHEGYLDEFGVWNRTLSTEEMNVLYNFHAGNPYSFGGTLTTIIKDEITRENITNASLKVNSETFFDIFTTTNGFFNLGNLPADNYSLEYDSDDFFLRRYYLEVTQGSDNNINLYSLNTSQNNAGLITYEVQDENGVPLSNVTVKALRFYPELNAYIIVEMSVSDDEGAGGLHLEKIDPKYRFIVERNGAVILTTVGAQIFQDSILLRADLSEDVIESLVAVVGMQKSLTFSNTTNNFELIWSDSTGVTSQVCLTVSKVALRSTTIVNNSCVSAASGSITLGIGENRTGQYVARADLETSTPFSPAILTELSVWLENNLATFGGMAIFISALLIVGVSLTLLFMTNSAIGGIMGVLIGVVFSMMLGILSIGITVVMGLVTIGLLVMFLTRARGAT